MYKYPPTYVFIVQSNKLSFHKSQEFSKKSNLCDKFDKRSRKNWIPHFVANPVFFLRQLNVLCVKI